MEKETGKEPFTIETEDIIKANGRTTKWMVLGVFIMNQGSWPIKVNGLEMNFMVEERYIMTTLKS